MHSRWWIAFIVMGVLLRVDPTCSVSQFLRSDDSPGWGELEEKGIYKKEGAVVGKKMKKMLQGGFGDFYSIATVACGNAAMVSTVATQRVVIRGSPKPKTFKPLV